MKNLFLPLSFVLLSTFACTKNTEDAETFHTVEREIEKDSKKEDSLESTLNTEKKLPLTAEEFLQKEFQTETIQSIILEDEGQEYKVQLSQGIQIEFDAEGNWKEIKSVKVDQSINTSYLPQKMIDYLIQNYSNLKIKSVEKDKNQYSIEFFQQNFEVKFNANGDFLTIKE